MFHIYRITNLVNGKTYIGQHKYKKLDDNYMGSGTYLARAKKKYGIENFTKEILYSNIQYKETADDIERFAIAKERALGKAEYNIANGGQGGNGGLGMKGKTPWNKGKQMSEEQKKKCSEARKGKKMSEEAKKKLSEHNKGKRLSEEHKRKIAETLEGHSVSDETRKKLKANKGWHHTEETKKKLSETHKGIPGRPMSDETKRKLSEANKKENLSEETLRKRSEAVKGKKWFNNGKISVMCYECPEGFVPGRMYQRKKEGR